MIDCEFSVIKYIPDIVRFEPVNIGIALLDKQNKKMHNKYITNFNAFFKRLGVDNIHGLERSFENYKPVLEVDTTDYLWKLHDSFHGSIFYAEPITVTSQNIDITLQLVFDKMISITQKQQDMKEIISVSLAKTKIRQYIEKLTFPKNSYSEKYQIDVFSGIPQTRDFAFMKNDELINTIDVFNFSDNAIFDSLKLFIYEIRAIISSTKYPKNQPLIFGTLPIIKAKLSSTINQSIEFLNMNKIPIINPELQEQKIQEIRSIMA